MDPDDYRTWLSERGYDADERKSLVGASMLPRDDYENPNDEYRNDEDLNEENNHETLP